MRSERDPETGELLIPAEAPFVVRHGLAMARARERRDGRRADPRLIAAKARLDRLDLYPTPVRVEGVRVLVWSWFFRWFFPQYDGLTWTARTIIVRDLDHADDLLVHELCHVWQTQSDGWLRTTWAYLRYAYLDNPYEREARLAVRATARSIRSV